MNDRFVAYYRVSTTKQGINGLGMDAQRDAVARFLSGGQGSLQAEFAEVESGKRKDRPELAKAVGQCRKQGATLLIAKLDRLARNAAFLLNLRDSGVDFIAVDMPHADRFTVGIMALVAEKERDQISQRTKDGLAAAKRRGIKLGNPRPAKALRCALEANQRRADAYANNLVVVIDEIKNAHVASLRGIARCLNARGFRTPNGKAFAAQSVKNVLCRQTERVVTRTTAHSATRPTEVSRLRVGRRSQDRQSPTGRLHESGNQVNAQEAPGVVQGGDPCGARATERIEHHVTRPAPGQDAGLRQLDRHHG